MRTPPILALVGVCLPLPSLAGPWVRAPGSGYAKLGWSHFQSADGVRNGESTGLAYGSNALDAYAELGLPGDLQVIASLPLVGATNRAADGVVWGHTWTGDLRLELDRRLLPDKPLAIGVEVRVPTYAAPSSYGKARNLPNELVGAFQLNFPELGDRNVDVTAKVMGGVGGSWGWFTAEGGPRFRTGGYAHGLAAATSLGVWAVPDRVGLGLYASGNVNVLPAAPLHASKQLVYAQASAFVTGLPALPGAGLNVAAGIIPVASAAASGVDVSISTFYTW